MDKKKSEKKNIKTYNHITEKKNKKNPNKNTLTKNISKINNKTNVIRKTKALSNNNLFANKDINDALDNRFNYRFQNRKENLIQLKRLTVGRTLRKKYKENNLTNNNIIINNKNEIKLNINLNQILSKEKKRNKNNKSQIKENTNKTMILDNNINNKNLRKPKIFHNKKDIYENLNILIDTKEKKYEDEIRDKILRLNTTEFILEKNILFSEENNKQHKKSIFSPMPQLNTDEHELDKYFNQNNNNINDNNELPRFSNISKINKNDLFYINNINEKRNSVKETRKRNESPELFEFEENINIIEEINKEQIITIPCLNCDKLINIDEIDEHSNKCYNINKSNSDNYINIIENKLKNILEYLQKIEKNDINNINIINSDFKDNLDLISKLRENIIQILNIKEINSSSINNLSQIKNSINILMQKNINLTNIFTLLSRTNILLEEKIKFFSEKNKNKKIIGDNSMEEIMSDSETTEFLDIKKIEKILDKKELKTDNLEKLINETKNKRLFLMEVLKVKFQKIDENKNENLIPPEMIWKEAVKNNIEMKNWTQFIFNELQNPNKYLKIIQDQKNPHQNE